MILHPAGHDADTQRNDEEKPNESPSSIACCQEQHDKDSNIPVAIEATDPTAECDCYAYYSFLLCMIGLQWGNPADSQ
eukprot:gene44313-59114_t